MSPPRRESCEAKEKHVKGRMGRKGKEEHVKRKEEQRGGDFVRIKKRNIIEAHIVLLVDLFRVASCFWFFLFRVCFFFFYVAGCCYFSFYYLYSVDFFPLTHSSSYHFSSKTFSFSYSCFFPYSSTIFFPLISFSSSLSSPTPSALPPPLHLFLSF